MGASDASARSCFGGRVWVSPPKIKPRVHSRWAQLQSVLRVWSDISLLFGVDVDYGKAKRRFRVLIRFARPSVVEEIQNVEWFRKFISADDVLSLA